MYYSKMDSSPRTVAPKIFKNAKSGNAYKFGRNTCKIETG